MPGLSHSFGPGRRSAGSGWMLRSAGSAAKVASASGSVAAWVLCPAIAGLPPPPSRRHLKPAGSLGHPTLLPNLLSVPPTCTCRTSESPRGRGPFLLRRPPATAPPPPLYGPHLPLLAFSPRTPAQVIPGSTPPRGPPLSAPCVQPSPLPPSPPPASPGRRPAPSSPRLAGWAQTRPPARPPPSLAAFDRGSALRLRSGLPGSPGLGCFSAR
ncbi:lysine-rich arabinogalactan protein 19-like [Cervus canadensis]|uniref:lysine-rich arabinogalactan protein 19-like n=1 Tax=Cervus canadensis TaxID=1574408 RepID=UPI001C9E52D7|nr:lysine-rich arabinogalactan protein 19-like [Cervus canadensis]